MNTLVLVDEWFLFLENSCFRLIRLVPVKYEANNM